MSSGTTTILRWDSGIWLNGQQRNLTTDNIRDPYDERLSIHSGSNGRRVFITGTGYLYQSGHKVRVDVRSNIYNSKLALILTFNPSLTAISFRLRSRRKEPNVPADNTNRFGGYVATLYRDKVEFRKENFINNYTNLTPASVTFPVNLVDRQEFEVNLYLFENLELGDDHIFKMQIDRYDGGGMKTVGKAKDTTPAIHVKNIDLYNHQSYTSITTLGNGSGSQPLDVRYRNLSIYDIGDSITPNV